MFVWPREGVWGISFLCYQILPFVFHHMLGLIGFRKNSVVLVISLLVSLIVDQVQKFCKVETQRLPSAHPGTGIVAMALELLATNSSLQRSRLFFCAPESLMRGKWREALQNLLVSARQ